MFNTLPDQENAVHQIPSKAEDAVDATKKAHSATLLRRAELAVELGCSLRTIDKLQADGVPCLYIGRSRRFILSEVIAWLKRKGGRA